MHRQQIQPIDRMTYARFVRPRFDAGSASRDPNQHRDSRAP
jgi:hypothetical protein